MTGLRGPPLGKDGWAKRRTRRTRPRLRTRTQTTEFPSAGARSLPVRSTPPPATGTALGPGSDAHPALQARILGFPFILFFFRPAAPLSTGPLAGREYLLPAGGCAGSWRGLSSSVHKAAKPNVVHQAQHQKYGEHARAAVTHKRQRNAGDRHAADHHAHINQQVE